MVIMFDVHEDDHLDHGDEWPTFTLLTMAVMIKIYDQDYSDHGDGFNGLMVLAFALGPSDHSPYRCSPRSIHQSYIVKS